MASLTCAENDCQKIDFNNNILRYFHGDLIPYDDDNNNNWIKFSTASPSSSKKIFSSVVSSGSYHTVSFDWKIEGPYSEFFRIKFGIDGNWAYCDSSPFFKNIDNDNASYQLEWILEHDERTHVGNPPTASAQIGNIELCGLIFENNRYRETVNESIENPPAFKKMALYPPNGSILDSYNLEVEVENFVPGSEIRLWTLEEPVAGWNIKETTIFNGSSDVIKFNNIFFNSWGMKKFKFSYGNELYSSESAIEVFPVLLEPAEGSNWDRYNYSLMGVNFPHNEEVILEIMDRDDSEWIKFDRPILYKDNLTFVVHNLDFIKAFLPGNDIDYKFIVGNREIGPFKGPHITDLFNNSRIDPQNGAFKVDYRSEICGKNICLKYNNHTTFPQTYTKCRDWQTLVFNGLDLTDPVPGVQNIELVDCHE